MVEARLEFGWMADQLADQLGQQGIPHDSEEVEHFQKDSDAISRLRVRGVLTPSEGDRAYDRLAKRIWQNLGGHQTHSRKEPQP